MTKRQLNLYLDEELIKEIKHSAIEADSKLSDHVADILSAHLENKRRASEYVARVLREKGDR